jgi:thiol-disulfide isomerase/thioredoxin
MAEQFSARDTTLEEAMADSSLCFTDHKEMYKYWSERSRQVARLSAIAAKDFTEPAKRIRFRDSVALRNQDLFTVVVIKSLNNFTKDENSVLLVAYNTGFATFVTGEQRLKLFYSYPKIVQNSELGKTVFTKITAFGSRNSRKLDERLINQTVLEDLGDKKHGLATLLDNKKYPYYLLVMGASWCSPCRQENIMLKQMIDRIDTTQVKIIGISIDEDRTSWKYAVAKDNCPWDNFRLMDGIESALVKTFVPQRAVPYNILLSKDHTILRNHSVVELTLGSLPKGLYKKPTK